MKVLQFPGLTALCIALIVNNLSFAQKPEPQVGLDGYCPVCITKMKKWVKGDPSIRAIYDGKTYHFPSKDARTTFQQDPAQYVPVLGGDCTVCLAKMGKRIPGSIFHAAYHDNRPYLFPGDDQKEMFLAHPEQFANVDLALNGNCAVCLKEMKMTAPGSAEFQVIHHEMRYLFPGEKQKEMFLKDPLKYVPDPQTKSEVKFIQGTSACAACDFGVKPMNSNELGLAVKSQDGKVYIIEDAYQKYPRIYQGRFGGLALAVQGRVLKEQGRFVWIDPTSVVRP